MKPITMNETMNNNMRELTADDLKGVAGGSITLNFSTIHYEYKPQDDKGTK